MVQKSLKKKDETSLAEKAKKDKESGGGVGRGNKMERTREAFKAWLLIPRTYLGAGDQVLRALGIIDPETVELYSIKSQTEFATKFNIAEPTLSHWKREVQKSDYFKEFRVSMQQLTQNVVGALYRQAVAEGDAQRVKLWVQLIEGWNETIGQDIRMQSPGLTDEEKASLDRLIEKNTVRMPD